jgi:luciferase-like monooxygenase
VIFAFVVRNFRWLARAPGAPQIFDAALLISTALFSPSRLRAISAVEKEARRLPDVNLGVHRYGGIGFFFRGKETSHIHGNGLLDCFVGRANRDLLLGGSGGVIAHHVFPRSGWISFFVKDPDDVERALELIQIACAYRENAE